MTMTRQLFSALSTLLIVAVCYLYLDQAAALWCQSHLSPQEKEIFTQITVFGESTFYLIGSALAFAIFRFLWKQPRWENIALLLFTSIAVSGIAANIIKVIAGRYRPSELFEHGLYGFDFFHIERALTSFPSGHTATAFTLAVVIAYLWPKSAIPVWTFAVLIGVSRLAIGAHYPSDIIAGAVLGVVSTLMLIRYWNTSKRLKDKPLL